MNRKSPIEQERANLIKITRTLVRLKHSIDADNELNDLIPDRLEEFDRGIQSGELKTLAVPTSLDGVANAGK